MSSPLSHAQQQGIKALTNIELLTLIVSNAATPKAREQALQAIERVVASRDSIAELLSADVHELLAYGCDATLAHRLAAVLELTRRLSLAATARYRIECPEDAAQLMMPQMRHLTQEQTCVLVLDSKNSVMAEEWLYQGTAATTALRAAEVFRPAILRGGSAILVCHNHPSGDTTPSPEDLQVTRQLVQAGALLDIALIDHLIIGNGSYTSIEEYLAEAFQEP